MFRSGSWSSVAMGMLIFFMLGVIVYVTFGDGGHDTKLLAAVIGIGIPLSAILALSVFGWHGDQIRAGQATLHDHMAEEVAAAVRKLLPIALESVDLTRQAAAGQALLRNSVDRQHGTVAGYLTDIGKHTMKSSASGQERFDEARRQWAAVRQEVAQVPDAVRQAVAEAVGPALKALAAREARAREVFMAEVRSVTDDLTDRVDALAAGGYEHVEPGTNVRTFVPADTMDALRILGGTKLPPPRSSGS